MPPGLYVKKGPDAGPLSIYATQCLTPVLVQLGTGHYLWKGGEGKIRGAICINKLLEGGAIKFFQENEGGGCN